MDHTVQFLWSRHQGLPVSAADWAIRLLESGFESDAILRLTDRNADREVVDGLIRHALCDINRDGLLKPAALRAAYERECVMDYYSGLIDGWTLIRRGCELYYEYGQDEPSLGFWMRLAEDADGHGGQGISLEYPFAGHDFDDVLRTALRDSGRPIPTDRT